jgi:uncharacterized repeat protein (TIGR03803 family)
MRSLAVVCICVLATGIAFAGTENILYTFNYTDGLNPWNPVIFDKSGNIYGLTGTGGANGYGEVFQLLKTDDSWQFNILYSFSGGGDGAYPWYSTLTMDASGNLYGTTAEGGAYGTGVVFELVNSHGRWTETVLHNFTGGSDGGFPYSGLTLDSPAVTADSEGALYGTTQLGGDLSCNQGEGCGTVYKLARHGSAWNETVLFEFEDNNHDGIFPYSAPTFDRSGNLYGTAFLGGNSGFGVVYKLTRPRTSGLWSESILHSFAGNSSDSCSPASGLTSDQQGNLYGTTWGSNCGVGGTVYQLSKSNKGYTYGVIFNLQNNGFLAWPVDIGTLALDLAGNIYGSIWGGGVDGDGILFKLQAGSWNYTDLLDFDYANGAAPFSAVVLDNGGNLYGTTENGGNGYGIVYEFAP